MKARLSKWAFRGASPVHAEPGKTAGAAVQAALQCTPGLDLSGFSDAGAVALRQADTLESAIAVLQREGFHARVVIGEHADLAKTARKSPVVMEAPWPHAWETVQSNGFVVSSTEAGFGERRCVCIVGYDSTRQAFRILESRGQGWGQLGRAWVPEQDLVSIAESLVRVERRGKA